MTDAEFVALVAEMRAAQVKYFKTRNRADLASARRCELSVDLAIDARKQQAVADGWPRAEPSLFDKMR
jgi:hypothetical protein